MSILKDPYQKVCKNSNCRKEFIAKRLNQEYHSPQCKMRANNGSAKNIRATMKKIDQTLKRNWKILEGFNSNGITIVEIMSLVTQGFDFTRHTGRLKDKNSEPTIPEFYNYALEKISNTQFKIVKLW